MCVCVCVCVCVWRGERGGEVGKEGAGGRKIVLVLVCNVNQACVVVTGHALG